MKKKSLLWISALLLILAGCSSDEIGDASDLVGYWKVIGTEQVEDPSSQGGLCFTKNGEIIEWGMNSKIWYERHTGKWWVSDEGKLEVDVYEGSMCRVYTGIEKLSKNNLIIRNWGGFAGTSREKGSDVEYKKLNHAPNYDNLSKIEW